jgi:hypothetical protein
MLVLIKNKMNIYTSQSLCMTFIVLFLISLSAVIFNNQYVKRKMKIYELN